MDIGSLLSSLVPTVVKNAVGIGDAVAVKDGLKGAVVQREARQAVPTAESLAAENQNATLGNLTVPEGQAECTRLRNGEGVGNSTFTDTLSYLNNTLFNPFCVATKIREGAENAGLGAFLSTTGQAVTHVTTSIGNLLRQACTVFGTTGVVIGQPQENDGIIEDIEASCRYTSTTQTTTSTTLGLPESTTVTTSTTGTEVSTTTTTTFAPTVAPTVVTTPSTTEDPDGSGSGDDPEIGSGSASTPTSTATSTVTTTATVPPTEITLGTTTATLTSTPTTTTTSTVDGAIVTSTAATYTTNTGTTVTYTSETTVTPDGVTVSSTTMTSGTLTSTLTSTTVDGGSGTSTTSSTLTVTQTQTVPPTGDTSAPTAAPTITLDTSTTPPRIIVQADNTTTTTRPGDPLQTDNEAGAGDLTMIFIIVGLLLSCCACVVVYRNCRSNKKQNIANRLQGTGGHGPSIDNPYYDPTSPIFGSPVGDGLEDGTRIVSTGGGVHQGVGNHGSFAGAPGSPFAASAGSPQSMDHSTLEALEYGVEPRIVQSVREQLSSGASRYKTLQLIRAQLAFLNGLSREDNQDVETIATHPNNRGKQDQLTQQFDAYQEMEINSIWNNLAGNAITDYLSQKGVAIVDTNLDLQWLLESDESTRSAILSADLNQVEDSDVAEEISLQQQVLKHFEDIRILAAQFPSVQEINQVLLRALETDFNTYLGTATPILDSQGQRTPRFTTMEDQIIAQLLTSLNSDSPLNVPTFNPDESIDEAEYPADGSPFSSTSLTAPDLTSFGSPVSAAAAPAPRLASSSALGSADTAPQSRIRRVTFSPDPDTVGDDDADASEETPLTLAASPTTTGSSIPARPTHAPPAPPVATARLDNTVDLDEAAGVETDSDEELPEVAPLMGDSTTGAATDDDAIVPASPATGDELTIGVTTTDEFGSAITAM